HRINGKDYLNTVMDFFRAYLKGKALPQLKEHIDDGHLKHVSIDTNAKKVILWQAYNPSARDFRYGNNIRYKAINLSQEYADIGPCLISLPKLPEKSGFFARFLEVRFKGLTLTSKVYITPDTFLGATNTEIASPMATK
ncbi:MAG: PhoPQ-activated protein PqaA family protein, partial [Cellvibrionales bacterium]|nr:PhoPQ-activated protein PqaA family protein [Cellvibrionales bacterium]